MNEFWQRADSEDAAFRADEARSLSLFSELVATGVLKRATALNEIECDACGDAHIETVEWITAPAWTMPRAFIGCPVEGRVAVSPEQLEVWKIDFETIAMTVARSVESSSSPRVLKEGRLWALGPVGFGERTRDTFLVRGSCWHDGCTLLFEHIRLATSACPVILVVNALPGDPAWRADGRTVLPMPDFDWFGNGRGEVLSVLNGILAEHDRSSTPVGEHSFLKQGHYWTIVFGGTTIRLKHTKGLLYLSYLLASSGREISATQLVAAAGGTPAIESRSSTGDVLDDQAIAAYKARGLELNEEIEKSQKNNDLGRVESLRNELDFLTEEIRSARGLGGRRRRSGDTLERNRKSVRIAIARAKKDIRKVHAELAQYLGKEISMGTYLSYKGHERWNT